MIEDKGIRSDLTQLILIVILFIITYLIFILLLYNYLMRDVSGYKVGVRLSLAVLGGATVGYTPITEIIEIGESSQSLTHSDSTVLNIENNNSRDNRDTRKVPLKNFNKLFTVGMCAYTRILVIRGIGIGLTIILKIGGFPF